MRFDENRRIIPSVAIIRDGDFDMVGDASHDVYLRCKICGEPVILEVIDWSRGRVGCGKILRITIVHIVLRIGWRNIIAPIILCRRNATSIDVVDAYRHVGARHPRNVVGDAVDPVCAHTIGADKDRQ